MNKREQEGIIQALSGYTNEKGKGKGKGKGRGNNKWEKCIKNIVQKL